MSLMSNRLTCHILKVNADNTPGQTALSNSFVNMLTSCNIKIIITIMYHTQTHTHTHLCHKAIMLLLWLFLL
jgi:hypothetical protein